MRNTDIIFEVLFVYFFILCDCSQINAARQRNGLFGVSVMSLFANAGQLSLVGVFAVLQLHAGNTRSYV